MRILMSHLPVYVINTRAGNVFHEINSAVWDPTFEIASVILEDPLLSILTLRRKFTVQSL